VEQHELVAGRAYRGPIEQGARYSDPIDLVDIRDDRRGRGACGSKSTLQDQTWNLESTGVFAVSEQFSLT
jgi:hypothetical protein